MRLQRSEAATRRYAAMSRYELFVFVEGWTDRAFYSRMCEALDLEGKYQVKTAEGLAGSASGGKPKLLSLFQSLKARNELEDVFQGKRSMYMFFLDKDLDDWRGTMVTSAHVVYTLYYHMENYLYRHGDLVASAMAAGAIDANTARQVIGDPAEWRRGVALAWQDWVKLCVHAALDGISCRCTYRSPSQINDPSTGDVDDAKKNEWSEDLLSKCGCARVDAERRRDEIAAKVDERYTAGAYDEVFKGAWYARYLASQLHAKVAPGARTGLVRALSVAALTGLNFREPWATHLTERIRALTSS